MRSQQGWMMATGKLLWCWEHGGGGENTVSPGTPLWHHGGHFDAGNAIVALRKPLLHRGHICGTEDASVMPGSPLWWRDPVVVATPLSKDTVGPRTPLWRRGCDCGGGAGLWRWGCHCGAGHANLTQGTSLWRRGRICGSGNDTEEAGRPLCCTVRHRVAVDATVSLGAPL